MPFLLLLDTILVPPIASTSLLPLNVVVFSLNIATVPFVLDWYFPLHVFAVWEEQPFQIQLAFLKLDLKVNLVFFFQMFVS